MEPIMIVVVVSPRTHWVVPSPIIQSPHQNGIEAISQVPQVGLYPSKNRGIDESRMALIALNECNLRSSSLSNLFDVHPKVTKSIICNDNVIWYICKHGKTSCRNERLIGMINTAWYCVSLPLCHIPWPRKIPERCMSWYSPQRPTTQSRLGSSKCPGTRRKRKIGCQICWARPKFSDRDRCLIFSFSTSPKPTSKYNSSPW